MSLAGFLIAALLSLQTPDPVPGAGPRDALERLTLQAIGIARANAGRARLSDGSSLPAATPEDRRLFAVPPALESQTVLRGLVTGQLEYCRADGIGLSFLPYMARLRASGRYSDRQLAYLGVLHGVSQQMIMDAMAYDETDVCADAGFRERLGAMAETMAVETP